MRLRVLICVLLSPWAIACTVVPTPPCTGGGGCDPNATCSDVNGEAICTCNSGYAGDGIACISTGAGGPCGSDNGGCDLNATCTDSGDAGVCTCNAGFEGDGTTCTATGLTDPCETDDGGTCDPNATCTVVVVWPSCVCDEGYSGDGLTCTAIDPCKTNNGGCDANAACAYSGPGMNSCTCNEDYVGDGTSCVFAGVVIEDGATQTSSPQVKLQLQAPNNLLTNADLSSGFLTGWMENTGESFAVGGTGLFSGMAYQTAAGWDVRSQQVDLSAAGYSQSQISVATFEVVDWAVGQGDLYYLYGELRDADGGALVSQSDGTRSVDAGTQGALVLSGQWAPFQLSLSSDAGARYLYIEDGSSPPGTTGAESDLDGGTMSNTWAGPGNLQIETSSDGTNWSTPQPYAPQIPYALTTTGTNTVYVRYLDANSNVLASASATINFECPAGEVFSGGTCLQ